MTVNRCTSSTDGLFNCGVDWKNEAGSSTCKYFVHDVLFWSQCGHYAVGRCMCFRASTETARRQAQNMQRNSIDEILLAMNKLFWIVVEEERRKREKDG